MVELVVIACPALILGNQIGSELHIAHRATPPSLSLQLQQQRDRKVLQRPYAPARHHGCFSMRHVGSAARSPWQLASASTWRAHFGCIFKTKKSINRATWLWCACALYMRIINTSVAGRKSPIRDLHGNAHGHWRVYARLKHIRAIVHYRPRLGS